MIHVPLSHHLFLDRKQNIMHVYALHAHSPPPPLPWKVSARRFPSLHRDSCDVLHLELLGWNRAAGGAVFFPIPPPSTHRLPAVVPPCTSGSCLLPGSLSAQGVVMSGSCRVSSLVWSCLRARGLLLLCLLVRSACFRGVSWLLRSQPAASWLELCPQLPPVALAPEELMMMMMVLL